MTKLATGALPTEITVASANIVDGTIVNADIGDSAAIALTKLATGTSGNIIVFNNSGVATATELTGDISISNTGVTTINADSVALGTDTTGSYVQSLVAGTGVTLSNNSGESATPTIAIGQAIASTDSPSFAGVTADAVQIGITAAGEIDTVSGNLTIDSAGGTVTIDDNLIVSGNLTINGTTTTINATTITVDDKNIELGSVETPSDATASGGGITLKGDTDKTITWELTNGWTSSETLNLSSGKTYKINGADVLSSTSLGSGITGSSLTGLGTVASGTWQATVIGPTYGGTGVNNGSNTITLAGNLITSGANSLTFTTTDTTNVTIPTTGTLATLAGSETFTNKTLTSPTLNTPTITLATSSSTTDARLSWDSTNKKIKVGNGTTSLDFASSTLVTNAQTASYTLVLGDKDKLVEIDNASANNLTIPLNSSVAFPIGTQINILQTGAGTTTLVATGGVTLNATPGLILRARWSSVTLIKRGTDTWVAVGDLRA